MSVKRPSRLAAFMLGSALGTLVAATAHADGTTSFGAPPLAAPGAFLTQPPVQMKAAAWAASGKPAQPWILDLPKPPDAAGQAETPSATSEPDLSALRYYASQNDLARVAAEIRLLRARFPGWEPPPDLFTDVKSKESDQPMWDLFAKHDLDGLEAAIADRRAKMPSWQPPTELTDKLALAEAYDTLVKSSNAQDYAAVIDLAASHRGLLTCGTVDALWRVAEALVKTGDEGHALDAYRYILTNCTNPQERLATVQKATALIKAPEAFDALVKLGRRQPNGTSEFGALSVDRLRQRIGDVASGQATDPPTPAEIDQIAAKAKTSGGQADAELLGWYGLHNKDFVGAETWFRAALQAGPSPKAAEGLVLSLRDGGKMPEAIKLAPLYAPLGPLNRKLMMEVLVASLADAKDPLPATQLAALGAEIDAEKSADAAQSLGWSRYKANDLREAETWFHKSLDWQPSEPAAIGLLVTSKRLKEPAVSAEVTSRYRDTYPRVAELERIMQSSVKPARSARPVREARRAGHVKAARGGGEGWDQSATAIVQTFQAGQLDQALAMMDARHAHRAEPTGLSVVRGWALYKKGDWDGAKQVFNDVGRRGMTTESEKGLREIELGYTNPRFR